MYIKRTIKVLSLLLLALVPLTLYDCDVKVTAMGYPNRIFVFADSTLWSEAEDDFRAVFEKEVATPHAENRFHVTWKPLEDLNTFKDRLNLFFLGIENEDTPVNNYVKGSLPQEFRDGVQKGEMFYFFADDLFARDQIGSFMYAKDRASFKRHFNRTKKDIYNRFEQKYFTRLKKEMYAQGEQKDLEKILASNYGWKVRVQHDYFIANQDKEEHYVWLRRIQPNRWLSVWKVKGDSSLIQRDSLIHLRNRMTETYYEGDTVEEGDTFISLATLGDDREAIKLTGLWRNDSLLVGGPFRMYGVYDEMEQALYLIDIAVMAPGQMKMPFLDQLEVIAGTFEIVRNTEKE